MRIQKGELELPFGTSDSLGYNGEYLGPTIRAEKGDLVSFRIANEIDEPTTVHWHGMHLPAEYDGGPHQVIPAGETWRPGFRIRQNAATLWYHPHLMGKTAEHVYRGLAGLFIIEDDYSRSLPIPREYGVNDIPLILQDRRVDRDGRIRYAPRGRDVMHGYLGNIMLVNGAYEPSLELPQGTYRFRILNGSNSTIMRLAFESGRPFTVIASDGGFLPESVRVERLVLSPGERYEILVDFDRRGEDALLSEIYGGSTMQAMSFSVTSEEGKSYAHPEGFRYDPVEPEPSSRTRNFRMETRGMGFFSINGSRMDLNRIDFEIPKNSTEVWTVDNIGMGMMNIPHSFHVHDVQFTVLSLNGSPPPPLYAGPKDTVLLYPGDRIEFALRFEEYTGIYMYHCHLLEHEDAGMMGQFMVK